MNHLDLNILKHFADITLKFLSEDMEYGLNGMWQNLDNANKLKERLIKLAPTINTIINHPFQP